MPAANDPNTKAQALSDQIRKSQQLPRLYVRWIANSSRERIAKDAGCTLRLANVCDEIVAGATGYCWSWRTTKGRTIGDPRQLTPAVQNLYVLKLFNVVSG
jgi:hypothetical protein